MTGDYVILWWRVKMLRKVKRNYAIWFSSRKYRKKLQYLSDIALKYRGMRLSEIMEKYGLCRSTVCVILKDVKNM